MILSKLIYALTLLGSELREKQPELLRRKAEVRHGDYVLDVVLSDAEAGRDVVIEWNEGAREWDWYD